MPAKLSFTLFPEKPITRVLPEQLHGLFFSLLSDGLANELHAPKRLKPFCLWSKALFSEKKTDRLRLEVSLLKDSLLPGVIASYMLEERELKLGDVPLQKSQKPLLKGESIRSYSKIYEEAEPSDTVVLDFLTPTSFKRGGADHPLPEPELIFRSLIRKWVAFSDFPLSVDLRKVIREGIFVSGAWIRTVKFELSEKARAVGFTGRVVLFVDSKDEEVLKWINALARFAEFAGVGRKTTMGMGKVRFGGKEETSP